MENGRKLLLWLVLFYCPIQTICYEIITVENGTHVVCVTDDNEDPIYIEPPQIEEFKETSLFIDDELFTLDDDWIFKDSLNATNGPILDKRWEDLPIMFANQTNFLRAKSLSFSIYQPKKIEFFVDDDEYIDYYSIEPSSTTSWVHYTLFIGDGNTYLYEVFLNNSKSPLLRRYRENFQPIQFIVRTDENTFWKIHNSTLREAEQVSESPTTLLLPKETQCSVIYTTLCPHCFLEVEVSEGKIYRIDGSEPSNLTQWKQLKISESSITSLNLKRGTTNGYSTGYWTLDIRKCPSEISTKATYEMVTGVPDQTHIPKKCKLLSEEKNDARSKRHINSFSDCKVGFLGQNCDVTCEALLGLEKKYCEGHRICENDNCKCAWGFQGNSCINPCSDGKWGLSCQSKCVGCKFCNGITGTCIDSPSATLSLSLESNLHNLFICITLVAMSFVIVIGTVVYVKHRGPRQIRSSNEAEPELEQSSSMLENQV